MIPMSVYKQSMCVMSACAAGAEVVNNDVTNGEKYLPFLTK